MIRWTHPDSGDGLHGTEPAAETWHTLYYFYLRCLLIALICIAHQSLISLIQGQEMLLGWKTPKPSQETVMQRDRAAGPAEREEDKETETSPSSFVLLLTACAISSEEWSTERDVPPRVHYDVGIGEFSWSGISTVNYYMTKEQQRERSVECVRRH